MSCCVSGYYLPAAISGTTLVMDKLLRGRLGICFGFLPFHSQFNLQRIVCSCFFAHADKCPCGFSAPQTCIFCLFYWFWGLMLCRCGGSGNEWDGMGIGVLMGIQFLLFLSRCLWVSFRPLRFYFTCFPGAIPYSFYSIPTLVSWFVAFMTMLLGNRLVLSY